MIKTSPKTLFKIILLMLVFSFVFSCGKKKKEMLSEQDKESLKREIEFGRLITAELLNIYGSYQNKDVIKYVNLVGKGLAIYVGRPEIVYRFAIVKSMDLLSLSAPGGYIAISLGLLKSMENEAQLASILAREIAHVNKNHLLKVAFKKGESVTIQDKLAQIDKLEGNKRAVEYSKLLNRALDVLTMEGLGKEKEKYADDFALKSIHSIGYNSQEMVNLLEISSRHEKKYNKAKTFPTLPPAEERKKMLLEQLKNENIKGGEKVEKRFLGIKKQLI